MNQIVSNVSRVEEELRSVTDNFEPLFLQAVTFWYKEYASTREANPPNASSLLEEGCRYGDMIFELVVESIMEEQEWTDEEDGYTKAVEVVSEAMDNFTELVMTDVMKILDSLQLFHASGYLTVDDGARVEWLDSAFHHNPLKGVW